MFRWFWGSPTQNHRVLCNRYWLVAYPSARILLVYSLYLFPFFHHLADGKLPLTCSSTWTAHCRGKCNITNLIYVLFNDVEGVSWDFAMMRRSTFLIDSRNMRQKSSPRTWKLMWWQTSSTIWRRASLQSCWIVLSCPLPAHFWPSNATRQLPGCVCTHVFMRTCSDIQ